MSVVLVLIVTLVYTQSVQRRCVRRRTVVDLEAELLADLGEEHDKVARLDKLEPVVKLGLTLRNELQQQLPQRHTVVNRGLRVGGKQAALI